MDEKYPDQGAAPDNQDVGAGPRGSEEKGFPPEGGPRGSEEKGFPPGAGGVWGGSSPPGEQSTERSVAHLSQTGDARVDDAVAALSRLDGRPPEEHVVVLEEVHGRLRDILGELAETAEAPEGPEQW
jgi:hypothetical protein